MCFDDDSRPPIAPIAGGALDSGPLTLTASDGNRFSAFRARATNPTGAGMLVLPDVRGLHHYYEELALRFAEAGVDAVAIDWFGRTAGLGSRGADFDYAPHVSQTSYEGITADITAAAEEIRRDGRVRSLFSIGFCFGGRTAFLTPTIGLGLRGAIGFYGWPTGPHRSGSPAPADAREPDRIRRSSACSAAPTRASRPRQQKNSRQRCSVPASSTRSSPIRGRPTASSIARPASSQTHRPTRGRRPSSSSRRTRPPDARPGVSSGPAPSHPHCAATRSAPRRANSLPLPPRPVPPGRESGPRPCPRRR